MTSLYEEKRNIQIADNNRKLKELGLISVTDRQHIKKYKRCTLSKSVQFFKRYNKEVEIPSKVVLCERFKVLHNKQMGPIQNARKSNEICVRICSKCCLPLRKSHKCKKLNPIDSLDTM